MAHRAERARGLPTIGRTPRIAWLAAGAGAAAALVLLGVWAWVSAPFRPGDRLTGDSAEVVARAAAGLLRDGAEAQVVLLGEDHRSPLPDALGAAMLRQEAFDCVALELHQDLQPAVDAYVEGEMWTRSVWPAVRQVFGVMPLALGQDRQIPRTARKQGVRLVAVDRFPRNLMRDIRHQRRVGQPVTPELRSRLVDDRDVEMTSALSALVHDGTCTRVLYTVGWNHVAGLTDRLEAEGIRVHATVVDHADVPPLPDPLTLVWEDGRIEVD